MSLLSHIAVTRDYADSRNIGETVVSAEPTRGGHKPLPPDDYRIHKAVTDQGGVRDSEEMATPEEITAQEVKDAIPPQPPQLTRQPAVEPYRPPHIHTKMDFAPFAASVYENDREAFMDRYTGRDDYYSYLPNQSNEELATYAGNDGSLIISIRGTATAGDVVTDRSILTGNPLSTPRFRRNIRAISDIIRHTDTPINKVVLVGHSLGGSIAAAGAVAMGVRAVTFNAGFSPAAMLRDPYILKYRKADITNFVTRGDVVSASSLLPLLPEQHVVERTASGVTGAHKMDNFLNQLGNFKQERGDLFAPGTNTEGRTSSVPDWISIPTKRESATSTFQGRIGEPLPRNPTLWQVLAGKEPPKAVSIGNDANTALSTIRDLRDIFRAPQVHDAEEPWPELHLSEPEEDEELLEDFLGMAEEYPEMFAP